MANLLLWLIIIRIYIGTDFLSDIGSLLQIHVLNVKNYSKEFGACKESLIILALARRLLHEKMESQIENMF